MKNGLMSALLLLLCSSCIKDADKVIGFCKKVFSKTTVTPIKASYYSALNMAQSLCSNRYHDREDSRYQSKIDHCTKGVLALAKIIRDKKLTEDFDLENHKKSYCNSFTFSDDRESCLLGYNAFEWNLTKEPELSSNWRETLTKLMSGEFDPTEEEKIDELELFQREVACLYGQARRKDVEKQSYASTSLDDKFDDSLCKCEEEYPAKGRLYDACKSGVIIQGFIIHEDKPRTKAAFEKLARKLDDEGDEKERQILVKAIDFLTIFSI